MGFTGLVGNWPRPPRLLQGFLCHLSTQTAATRLEESRAGRREGTCCCSPHRLAQRLGLCASHPAGSCHLPPGAGMTVIAPISQERKWPRTWLTSTAEARPAGTLGFLRGQFGGLQRHGVVQSPAAPRLGHLGGSRCPLASCSYPGDCCPRTLPGRFWAFPVTGILYHVAFVWLLPHAPSVSTALLWPRKTSLNGWATFDLSFVPLFKDAGFSPFSADAVSARAWAVDGRCCPLPGVWPRGGTAALMLNAHHSVRTAVPLSSSSNTECLGTAPAPASLQAVVGTVVTSVV